MLQKTNIPGRQIYYKQLDGLRFIAVTAVLLGHWALNAGPGFILSSSGVNLFFVLSGFLITQILIKNKLTDEVTKSNHWFSIKQFYVRRFLRIFPIYYLLILVTCSFNFGNCRDFYGWLITYTGNIYWIHNGPLMGRFSHLWSLAVEEQFYLLFPFFILLTPKRFLLKALFLIVIFSILLRLYYECLYFNEAEAYALMPCCLDCFGLGGILAYFILFNKEELIRIIYKRRIFIASALLFILCCLFRTHYFTNHIFKIFSVTFSRFFLSACCFWVIGIAATIEFKGLIRIFLENKAIIYIGKISYGVYLYHTFIPILIMYLPWRIIIPVFRLIHVTYPFNNSIVSFLWFYSFALIVSTISWYLIEKPINNLKKYFDYKSV